MKAKTNLKAGLFQGEPLRSSCRKLGGILLLLVIAALPSSAQKSSPNDPLFPSQWGLSTIGAVGPWRISTGSTAIVVAVIDSGIDYNHPDLQKNIWHSSEAFRHTYGLGLPGQYIDCPAGASGVNYINYTCDPIENGTHVDSETGLTVPDTHGTHVAGIIGAVGNNGTGVVGVNWNVSIMAVKAPDENYSFTRAINFAVSMKKWYDDTKGAHGANVRVINISWARNGGPPSYLQYEAIQWANAHNILVVAAAGNDGKDNDNNSVYPSNFSTSFPNVVSVAATDDTDDRSSFSNYGATSVSLAAPGRDILSTIPSNMFSIFGQGYGQMNGTSMAAPFVSGSAALILSACPDLDAASLKMLILDNVDPIPSLSGRTVAPPGHPGTGGRLNVGKAIAACVGAQMTDPPAGSALSSSSQIFNWSKGIGVAQYVLNVGTQTGKADISNKWTGTIQSATVPNLPADGKPIYVRLWSQIKGAWVYTDYAYWTVLASPAPAQLLGINPPARTSSTVTFTWSSGTGVTAPGYIFTLSSPPGRLPVYNYVYGPTKDLSVRVSNLPTDPLWNGNMLYLKIYSYIGGTWQHMDYVY